ncbi:MAG: carbamoyltransferase [Planctomycetota bacterium]|nr:MAG: carbamoyltransferase [Planctomycetota bacterium]
MIVLGLGSPFHHDPAAALLVDGEVVAAAEEERFTRKKHATRQLATHATRFCLEQAGVKPEQVDAVAFAWSPDSFEKHKGAYFRRCLRHRRSRALKALYRGGREHEKKKRKIRATLAPLGLAEKPVHWVDHHLSHASSAYHLSGFEDAAILTIDGSGEFTSTLFAEGVGGEIRVLHEILNPDSLGFFYSTITEYLGFRRDNGEFKTMGMSAYGDPSKVDVSHLLWATDDGYRINDEYVWAPRELRYREETMFSRKLVEEWGPPREGDGLAEPYIHVAAAAQKALEDHVLRLLERHLGEVLRRNGGRLCLAGGCALNVRMNRKILDHPLVEQVYVQPAAHDAGAPLGAASYVAWQQGERLRPMTHAYLGPEYGEADILAALERIRVPYRRMEDVAGETAALLAEGEIVAWFQGRMEFGPRALGNRSILASPAAPGISDEINARIKFREKWRPFCPSILAEDAPAVLGTEHPSPFMTFSFLVDETWRARIPEAVHVDGSARPQTVSAETNPRYHALLSAFKERTGLPVLINTSLNRRGEPMVCSPEDALSMFFGSGLEHLVLGDFYVTKRTLGAR